MGLNSYISQQFSNPAGIGGNFIASVMNKQNRSLYEETMRLLKLSDNESVLDIGCGNGYVLNMLARQYNCAFAGIDTSKSIVKTASRIQTKHCPVSHIRDSATSDFQQSN